MLPLELQSALRGIGTPNLCRLARAWRCVLFVTAIGTLTTGTAWADCLSGQCTNELSGSVSGAINVSGETCVLGTLTLTGDTTITVSGGNFHLCADGMITWNRVDGGAGQDGGDAPGLTIVANNIYLYGDIDLRGGNGGDGYPDLDGGDGGNGGSVLLESAGDCIVNLNAAIIVKGGQGGFGGVGVPGKPGGDGGNGGNISVIVNKNIELLGPMSMQGGNAGYGGNGNGSAGGSGGVGGSAGSLLAQVGTGVAEPLIKLSGAVEAWGGNGGRGGVGYPGFAGGAGGNGGDVTLRRMATPYRGTVILVSTVSLDGGNAGDGGAGGAGLFPGAGGDGGNGGSAGDLESTTLLRVYFDIGGSGSGPICSVRGGNAGSAGEPGANGPCSGANGAIASLAGGAGFAGNVKLHSQSTFLFNMRVRGTYDANGGNGGTGGSGGAGAVHIEGGNCDYCSAGNGSNGSSGTSGRAGGLLEFRSMYSITVKSGTQFVARGGNGGVGGSGGPHGALFYEECCGYASGDGALGGGGGNGGSVIVTKGASGTLTIESGVAGCVSGGNGGNGGNGVPDLGPCGGCSSPGTGGAAGAAGTMPNGIGTTQDCSTTYGADGSPGC